LEETTKIINVVKPGEFAEYGEDICIPDLSGSAFHTLANFYPYNALQILIYKYWSG